MTTRPTGRVRLGRPRCTAGVPGPSPRPLAGSGRQLLDARGGVDHGRAVRPRRVRFFAGQQVDRGNSRTRRHRGSTASTTQGWARSPQLGPASAAPVPPASGAGGIAVGGAGGNGTGRISGAGGDTRRVHTVGRPAPRRWWGERPHPARARMRPRELGGCLLRDVVTAAGQHLPVHVRPERPDLVDHRPGRGPSRRSRRPPFPRSAVRPRHRGQRRSRRAARGRSRPRRRARPAARRPR